MSKKYNLLVPMAGLGQRFSDAGHFLPKPLITVADRQIIDWSFSSLDPNWRNDAQLVFVVREEHVTNYALDKILRQKFGDDAQIVVQGGDHGRQGAVHSCFLAREALIPTLPLFIFTLDVFFTPKFDPTSVNWDNAHGHVLVFKANNPAYSYFQLDAEGRTVRSAEKSVISDLAAAGLYGFKTANLFLAFAKDMMARGDHHKTNGEWYISPLYNLLIDDGLQVRTQQVADMHVMGTPDEAEFFERVAYPFYSTIQSLKPIAVCCDHSGFNSKTVLCKILTDRGYPFIDFGTYTANDCDYPDFVWPAARSVQSGKCRFGIVLCRSGQGPAILANKLHGIRCALLYNTRTAKYSVTDNAANFFAVPQAVFDSEQKLSSLLDELLSCTFIGGRHADRVREILRHDDLRKH